MENCAQLAHDCASICEDHAANLEVGDHSRSEACIAACHACAAECEGMIERLDTAKLCRDICLATADACRQAEMYTV